MYRVPLENPQPNINNFIKIIKGESIPSRGVVINVLASYQESDLREYIRGILTNCMAKGKFALGSGNSITIDFSHDWFYQQKQKESIK